MTKAQKDALRITIDMLDDKIQENHNPTLIAISNELETMYQEAK